jgi:ABC-type sugar transport system substrate-binding protein
MIIGYIQTHPKVEYVYIPFDPAALSVVEALDTAGFTNIKVCSVLGIPEMLSLIRRGTAAASTAAYDSYYMGYACADQAIRILNGEQLWTPRGENVPLGIVDASNVPPEGKEWTPVFDYKAAYYSLWD